MYLDTDKKRHTHSCTHSQPADQPDRRTDATTHNINTCIYIYLCVCVCICMYMYVYTHKHECMYTHIHHAYIHKPLHLRVHA